MSASPTPSAKLRDGRAAELWSLALIAILSLILALLVVDLRTQPVPTPWIWWAYLVVQLLNKAPLSYRYPLRGAQVALDLGGFALSLAGVASVAAGVQVAPALCLALLAATLTYHVGVGIWLLRAQLGAPSVAVRIYCTIVAYWVPASPTLIAWLLLARAR
jgi:hypothetical protein